MHFKLKTCVVYLLAGIVLALSTDDVEETNNKQYNKFIRHIFNKYGSKGIINFEGFEHLLYNLGLGNIGFQINHTIEAHRPEGHVIPVNLWDSNDTESKVSQWHSIVFKELHEKAHKHHGGPARMTLNNMIPHKHGVKKCLSPLSIVIMSTDLLEKKENQLKTVKNKRHIAEEEQHVEEVTVNDLNITPEMFMELCPALIVQIDGHDCIEEPEPEPPSTYTYLQAWIYASCSILLISTCGLIGLLIIPLAKKIDYNTILGFLVSIAVGTLLGDALMHLLPHALMPHDDDNDDNHSKNGSHEHNKEPIFICLTSLIAAIFMYSLENLLPLIVGGEHNHSHHSHRPQKINDHATEEFSITDSDTKTRSNRIKPVAFMVIIGDGLHNVTDGLAIGAAFAVDPITGFSTALAVLCHELPHELGDCALLIKTGLSIKNVCHLNIMSSFLSLTGMVIGLLVSTEETAKWIYATTAGTFMYIALSDLVPEMQKDKDRGAKQIFVQIIGVLIGSIIMLFIGLYEDSLRYFFE